MFRNLIKNIAIVSVSMLAISFMLWSCVNTLLPDELTLIEGESTEISVALPISAKTEEAVGVIGVTTTPLADAFHLELGTSIVAEPLEQGETDLTFYLGNSVPLKTVSAKVVSRSYLVPVGQTFGITLDTKGILVLGTGSVILGENEVVEPSKGILKTGDLILEANGTELSNKETFLEIVAKCGGENVSLLVERSGNETEVEITPVFSEADQSYKLGIWVRDSIQGIGTVTFYDPKTYAFGALGHGVYDVDTGDLMVIKQGSLIPSQLTEIVKGEKGQPGELAGVVQKTDALADIISNTENGIFGNITKPEVFMGTALPVATKQEVQVGEATILSNIEGDAVKSYQITIESVNKTNGKDMQIRITDPELLQKTGGIVQGMSGSPIIQNGMIVGAVTHVFVNDPTKGYGIFIETMLKETKSIQKEVA